MSERGCGGEEGVEGGTLESVVSLPHGRPTRPRAPRPTRWPRGPAAAARRRRRRRRRRGLEGLGAWCGREVLSTPACGTAVHTSQSSIGSRQRAASAGSTLVKKRERLTHRGAGAAGHRRRAARYLPVHVDGSARSSTVALASPTRGTRRRRRRWPTTRRARRAAACSRGGRRRVAPPRRRALCAASPRRLVLAAAEGKPLGAERQMTSSFDDGGSPSRPPNCPGRTGRPCSRAENGGSRRRAGEGPRSTHGFPVDEEAWEGGGAAVLDSLR